MCSRAVSDGTTNVHAKRAPYAAAYEAGCRVDPGIGLRDVNTDPSTVPLPCPGVCPGIGAYPPPR